MSKKLIKEESTRFHDYSLYIPGRILYMGSGSHGGDESGVDGQLAERMIKNLMLLDSVSNKAITVIANNIGGEVYHGMAIFDAIKSCHSKVIMKVFGNCASMGSVILQAADHRIMSLNSIQMIHYGEAGYYGHDRTVIKQAKETLRINRWMEDMYLEKIKQKHPNFTMPKLKYMLDHDTFLTAAQSVDLGLADEILT